MSELPTGANQILISGQPQDEAGVVAEEPVSTLSFHDENKEDSKPGDSDTQAKMHSVLQQVRNQIRSQVVVTSSKSSIRELVQRLKDRQREVVQEIQEPEGVHFSNEENEKGKNQDDKDEAFYTIFEKKLEDNTKSLRDEFEEHISQMREDMRAYTDQALKDLECKMQKWQCQHLQKTHLKEQESKDTNTKQKPSAATLSRRGRVLTRTMTTIIPKTCAPVIVGPRAKSETVNSSKGESSQFMQRDPVLASQGNKMNQSRRPLPPTCPPLYQRKKVARPKTKSGNELK